MLYSVTPGIFKNDSSLMSMHPILNAASYFSWTPPFLFLINIIFASQWLVLNFILLGSLKCDFSWVEVLKSFGNTSPTMPSNPLILLRPKRNSETQVATTVSRPDEKALLINHTQLRHDYLVLRKKNWEGPVARSLCEIPARHRRSRPPIFVKWVSHYIKI